MKAKIRLIISLLIIAIVAFSTIYSTYAVTQQDLNEIQNKIEETEQERKEVQANLTAEMKKIDELDDVIVSTQYNLDKLQTQLSKVQKEITNLEKELTQKTQEYDKNYELACARIVAQYKYGNITYLDVLLNSTSLTNLLSNYYMVNQMLDYDQEFLEGLEESKKKIESDKVTLEKKKVEVEEEKKQVEKEKVVLNNKKQDRQRAVANLKAEDAALQKEKEEYAAEYDRTMEEWRRQAAQSGNGGSYTGGALGFPCPGFSRVSSRFGSRTSPLAGASSYHKGIDLAASKGTSILAAESGTVIKVVNSCTHNYGKSKSCRCGGGFGNYVMISHGGGLVTVYAHCTSINVGVNQKVSKGATIATVGSTGASSGFHLHFSVLLNGTYVDPAPYIGL